MQRERICRFCEKKLISPEGKRVPVVSVYNTLKNKDLLVDPGRHSVILAEELESLGHRLERGEFYSDLSCLSCARQVVRLRHSLSVLTRRCNEPLNRDQAPATSVSLDKETCTNAKRSTALRSPTGVTPLAKRNKEDSAENVRSTGEQASKSSRRSLNFVNQGITEQPYEEENPPTLEEKMQAAMNIPQGQDKPIVKVSSRQVYKSARQL